MNRNWGGLTEKMWKVLTLFDTVQKCVGRETPWTDGTNNDSNRLMVCCALHPLREGVQFVCLC